MGATGGRARARSVACVVVALLIISGVAREARPAAAAAIGPVPVERVATGISMAGDVATESGDMVWFTNTGNDSIGRLAPDGTLATFTAPWIDEPTAIGAGYEGNLYFSSSGNSTIGRITEAGVLTAFPVPGSTIEGVAAGWSGGTWFTDSARKRLLRLTPTGTFAAFSSAPATDPSGITPGPDGLMWFTSPGDDRVARIDLSGTVTAYADPKISGPTEITAGPDGNVWFANDDGTVGRISPSTGTVRTFPAAPMSSVGSLAFGPDGNLWYTIGQTTAVGRMTPAGVTTTFTAPGTAGARGILPGPGRSLWMATDHSLRSVSTSGVFTEHRGTGPAMPRAVTSGPDGNLWFTNRGTDSVSRMSTGGAITSFTSAQVDDPGDIVAGPDGNLWFTSVENGRIGRVSPAGTITTFGLPQALTLGSITTGPDGNVWFTGVGPSGGRIGRITTAGVVTLFGDAGMVLPDGIVGGPDGNIWFTNPHASSIGRITPSGAVSTFTSQEHISSPSGITNGPDGNLWYVNGTGSIGRITPGGDSSAIAVPGFRSVVGEDIVAGPDGALWFTRSIDGSLGRIEADGSSTVHGDPKVSPHPSGIAVGPDGGIWFSSLRSVIGRAVPPRTTPGAATSVTGTPGYRSVRVVWSPPSYTGGSPITGYTATADPGGRTCSTDGALACTVDGLDNGTTYTFTVVATNAQGDGAPSRASAPVELFGGATFHAITPVRILDSRTTTGGWNGRLEAGAPRSIAVAGVAGIPTTASAVVMNVTAVESDSDSFLTVFPRLSPVPNASNLNFRAGQIVPNLVTVKLGATGALDVATSNGATHVVADAVGYYDDGSGSGGRFTPISPRRLLDSRGPNGGWDGPLVAGEPRDLPVRHAGNPDGVPDTATAVVANVTVTQPDSQSFLSVWPSDVAQPDASNLNFVPGQTTPNLVTTRIGAGGTIRIANAVGSVHVVVDVVGYYQPDVGTRFFPIEPTRVLDSRFGNGLDGPWDAGDSRALAIGGRPGTNVPLAATGAVANVTVTDGTAQSLLTVYPDGVAKPDASNLNFLAGQVVANLVIVGLSPSGRAQLYNDQGSVDVVADVVGYFAPG